MRGPGLRSTLDVRRLWRCPSCGYERHLAQTTTAVMCFCKDPPLQMRLVEGKRVTRPEPRPVARFIDESELPPDDSPPAPVRIESVEVTETAVIDVTVETVVAPPSAETESEPSRNKKRRRRQRGRRDGSSDAPTTEGAHPNPPAEPPTSSGDADFGAGIEP